MDKKLGLWGACAYCIGGMIGSGVFLSSSSILQYTGSYGMALAVWTGAGLITVMAALVYLEMGTSIPSNGGGFAYLTKANWHPLAASFFWLGTFFTYPATMATLGLGMAQNTVQGLKSFTEFDDTTYVCITIFTTIASIVAVSILNLGKSISFQLVVTVAKVMVITVIIAIGIGYLVAGHTLAYDVLFVNSTTDSLDIVMATYMGLFSYSGYEVLNVVMGEIRHKVFTTTIAGTGTVIMVMFVYFLVNISYFTVIDKSRILKSTSISADFFNLSLGKVFGNIMPFVVSFLMLSNMNTVIFGGGRFMATGATNNILPSVIGYTNPDHNSPRLAILIQMTIAIGLSFVNNLSSLMSYMSFAELLDRFIVLSSFLYMRYKGTKFAEGAYHNHVGVVLLYFGICGALLTLPIYRVRLFVLSYVIGLFT
ncbi:unnamed protein product [Bursaphelenchus okinawaensis]|uniref:Amino acid permease n=1 Tax=Bursaphelenchus okinawaensis TaxID=465554 RepID=A0A811KBB0_9BILA|nr:unnamed protein product [Bursaphelenchus okinawaensis]CAG9095326.1 unnamed protein product [Bursaphelenchus okinawaensis]